MSQLRSKNIEKVARAVYSEESEREAFLCALEAQQGAISAVAWLRDARPSSVPYEQHTVRPAWLPDWIDVAAPDAHVGRLSEHERGDLYLLDLSSTFAVAPLSMITSPIHWIVDMCAAPGGKGIMAWRYCKPELVIGNEVIRKRTAQLISNYKRCGIDPAMVTSCDPGLLGTLIPETSQLVIVDAPCSGQSLLVKGLTAPSAFHPATIAMNERRQRRILAHSSKLVAPGGYLLYATCTFSPEENEENVEWFLKRFSDFHAVSVPSLEPYRSHLSGRDMYRLSPQAGVGAGAFCALLKRAGDADAEKVLGPEQAPGVVFPVWRSPWLEALMPASVVPDGNNPRDRGLRGKRRQGKRDRSWRGRDRE
jgi:16S rRNA C967 or C1407 C5-methylase (RsmB/RsmF family)